MGFSFDFEEGEDISESKFHKELEELLKDFIIQYVKLHPIDIIGFSEKYFRELYNLNKLNNDTNILIRGRSPFSSSMYTSTPRMSVRRSLHRVAVAADKYFIVSHQDSEDNYVKNENCPMSYSEYKDLTKNVFLLNSLDEEEISRVLNCMVKRETCPGEFIINEDDEGDFFYIINTGIFEAYIMKGKEPIKVKSYHCQGYFGEIALMYNCRRTATVVSRTNGILWCLDRKNFREIVVVKAFEKREICFKILRKVDLFVGFNDYELNNVADSVVRRTYHTNECIMSQGDEGEEMYIIEKGEVLITKKVNDKNKDLFRLHSGEYFGEISLILNSPRKVTAYAVTVVEIMVISKNWFYRLFGHCMESLKANLSKYIYFHLNSED